MIFDIRTPELARDTLENITTIPFSVWQKETVFECNYDYSDDFIQATMKKYSAQIPSFSDLDLIFTHLTSSNAECQGIKLLGLTDLYSTYSTENSELRQFIEAHGIHIRLKDNLLVYKDNLYDISFDDAPPEYCRDAYNAWLVGRKFYFDFCVCGFLSINPNNRYYGNVDKRPEILMNLDQLLGLHLSEEWQQSRKSYEVTAKVSGSKIVCDSESRQEKEKTLHYLCYAYNAAYGDNSEHILLCKNNVSIPADDILEIKEFTGWKYAL